MSRQILGCVLSVAFTCAMIYIFSTRDQFVSQAQQEVSAPIVQQSGGSEEALYYLRAHEGKLALFAAGEERPQQVFDVRIESLPKADQPLLEEGIAIYSEPEKKRLIEDYTS